MERTMAKLLVLPFHLRLILSLVILNFIWLVFYSSDEFDGPLETNHVGRFSLLPRSSQSRGLRVLSEPVTTNKDAPYNFLENNLDSQTSTTDKNSYKSNQQGPHDPLSPLLLTLDEQEESDISLVLPKDFDLLRKPTQKVVEKQQQEQQQQQHHEQNNHIAAAAVQKIDEAHLVTPSKNNTNTTTLHDIYYFVSSSDIAAAVAAALQNRVGETSNQLKIADFDSEGKSQKSNQTKTLPVNDNNNDQDYHNENEQVKNNAGINAVIDALEEYTNGKQIENVDVNVNTDSSKKLIVEKGANYTLEDGDHNLLLVIISNRKLGIIPTLASILEHSSRKVDLVLIGELDTNDQVNKHFGKRINRFISLTVEEVEDDLRANGINPIWTWPEWHSSIRDFDNWKNENTLHVADWDHLNTHAHELNHLRFYLPHVSLFQNKGYFYFLDDDVLVQKDLGPVADEVMKDLIPGKGMVTPCNIWIWNSECHHFNFKSQEDYILSMPSLYGDRNVCKSPAEKHCYPENYMGFIESVLPEGGKQQKAWNFGFSLFALKNWRELQLTKRYQHVMKKTYEKHVFPETSLTFGLGVAYLALAGAVECWNENKMKVRDGFGFIEWERYEKTFGKNFFEHIDVVHFTGPDKPWASNSAIDVNSVEPWLKIMDNEKLKLPDQLPTTPSHRLFTLLASDRTGAQWMISTLDSHPEVCASGEGDLPESGFPSDVLLPDGLPWYPHCSVKRSCTYAFIEESVNQLVDDIPDKRRRNKTPRRCMNDYDPVANKDPLVDNLERLCNFVERLEGNFTRENIGRLWVEAFVNEDKELLACRCPRGTKVKGLKVEPEWLVYDNFPDDFNGPARLILDSSKIHGSKIIRLKRRNLWARYKSMVMARASSQYHLETAEAKILQEDSVGKVNIAVEDLEWSINHMTYIDNFGDMWAKEHGIEVLDVYYEDCRDNTSYCFSRIFEFLGVDRSIASQESRYYSSFADLELDSSLEHIENRGAVEEALGVNGWSRFVDVETFHQLQLLIYDEASNLVKAHQIKGVNSTIFGQDPSSVGYGSKFTAAVPLLSAMPPTTLVIISDDSDVFINYPSGSDALRYEAIFEFRRAFMEITVDFPEAVVVSASAECCASALTHVAPGDLFDDIGRRKGRSCLSGVDGCEWAGRDRSEPWQSFMKELATKRNEKSAEFIYLDAGLIVGTAEDLLLLIKNIEISKSEDDRAVLTDYMHRYPEKVLLDYNQRLFSRRRESPSSSLNVRCKLNEDDGAAQIQRRRQSETSSQSLFVQSPRDLGCRIHEKHRPKRFPSWGSEGISLQPILEHFGRVLDRKESIVLSPLYGRAPDYRQGPEIPYVIDENGVFASGEIRNRTDAGTFKWRARPTEALVRLALRVLKKVTHPDEKSRWKNLLNIVPSGGFPFWAWYGDYKSCNYHNYDSESIPLLTTAARSDCNYAFPMPNYMTIIDTQRNSDHWHGVFREFDQNFPWERKIRKVAWRGTLSEAEWRDVFTSVRWRLAKKVMELESDLYDVGITSIPSWVSEKVDVELSEVGGLAEAINPMTEFMKYQAIIDMDGNSWSSRFGTLLCYNSVVIKVEPKFVEYFFSDLLPWTHYIPVKNDLSDLHENVAWALNPENEKEVKDIIAASNQWCSQRITPGSLAFDLLDIWEAYLDMLNTADPNWISHWQKAKQEIFSHSSLYNMQLI